MRIACLYIPHFQATVALRRQPHLRVRPVVIADSSTGSPRIVDALPAAAGVRPGMPLACALARCPDATVLAADAPATRRLFRADLRRPPGRERPGRGGGAGHGLRGPRRPRSPPWRRGRALRALQGRRSGGSRSAHRRGERQVPGLGRRPWRPGSGTRHGPDRRGRLPRPHSIDLLPCSRDLRDGLPPLRIAHPGGRRRPAAGAAPRPLRAGGPARLGALPGDRSPPAGTPGDRRDGGRADHPPLRRHHAGGPVGRGGNLPAARLRPGGAAGPRRPPDGAACILQGVPSLGQDGPLPGGRGALGASGAHPAAAAGNDHPAAPDRGTHPGRSPISARRRASSCPSFPPWRRTARAAWRRRSGSSRPAAAAPCSTGWSPSPPGIRPRSSASCRCRSTRPEGTPSGRWPCPPP